VTPRARLDRFLRAARRALEPADSLLVDAIAHEHRLAPQAVRFALAHHLELGATDDELDAMVARAAQATPAPAVLSILSANVFVAPFRALAWALARAPRVRAKASRRASALPSRLIAAAGAEGLDVASVLDVDAEIQGLPAGSIVDVEGAQPAIVELAAKVALRPQLRFAPHGPGIGVIVASAQEIVEAADAIAEDVAVFEQRGCLSPRVAIVLDAEPNAHRAALEALDVALTAVVERLPRGPESEAERSERRRALDAASFVGEVYDRHEHALVDAGAEVLLAPAGRVLTVSHARELRAAEALIARLPVPPTAVATGELHRAWAIERFAPARVAALGRLQRPRFDGPVDLRADDDTNAFARGSFEPRG
jgi:hypothetical protein